MLVQLYKCVVCVSDLQGGNGGDGCLTSSILFKYGRSMGTFVCSELVQGTTGLSGECCFGVMYCEWYGVYDFVVLSVVEVCLCCYMFLRLDVVYCVVM